MFRTLNYIYEVYQTKSFSKAAQNLFISQPSLSLTIKKFENDIGLIIFDRSTNPIQLTEAGKVYMEGVRKILSIKNDLGNYVDDYNQMRVGKLTIGAPHFFSGFLLPPLIAKFHNSFPNIEIKLVETDFLTLQNMTMSGDIDLIIESNEFDENLYYSYPLFVEHVLIAVPINDPVNDSLKNYSLTKDDIIRNKHLSTSWPSIPMEKLSNHNFLLLEKGHDMHQRATRFFHNSNFEPNIFMSLNQLMTTYNMTNQELGVSFVSDTIVKLTGYSHNILYYKVDDELSIRHINLAYKRNRYVSKPMQEFIEMVLNNNYEKLNKVDTNFHQSSEKKKITNNQEDL